MSSKLVKRQTSIICLSPVVEATIIQLNYRVTAHDEIIVHALDRKMYGATPRGLLFIVRDIHETPTLH